MTKSDGSRYEAPRALRLSDSPLGHGTSCHYGSNADANCGPSGGTANACYTGHVADATCTNHGETAHGCGVGDSPTFSCSTGDSVSF
jgi:hypothetical protein